MLRVALIGAALLLFVRCAVGTDVGKHAYACISDGDCIDGFICSPASGACQASGGIAGGGGAAGGATAGGGTAGGGTAGGATAGGGTAGGATAGAGTAGGATA